MKVKVLFFAQAKEIVGLKECQFEVPAIINYPALHELLISYFELELIKNNIIIAKNEELCLNNGNNIVFEKNDEIAILPPLSGG